MSEPFGYESLDALLDGAAAQGVRLPPAGQVTALAAPLAMGGKQVPNRLVAQPIEGSDADENGAPTPRTVQRYQALARGGWGMLWMESAAVSREGSTGAHQLMATEENTQALRSLVQAVRESGVDGRPPYTVLQLTHAGRNSAPGGVAQPVCAIQNPHIPKENARIITDGELEQLEDAYVRAALVAESAGFDAVDIRACHGYLINELLGAFERPGRYGGSFENRVRLLLSIIDKLRAQSPIDIAVRLNVYDSLPYPYGWGGDKTDARKPDLTEPLALVELLAQRGVRLLNVSAGIGAYKPFVIRPYNKGPVAPDETQLAGVARMLGFAQAAKQRAPQLPVVASAFSWLRQYGPPLAAGGVAAGWFDFAGFGRQTVAWSGFARQAMQGAAPNDGPYCETCSACSALVKNGKPLRCVLHKV